MINSDELKNNMNRQIKLVDTNIIIDISESLTKAIDQCPLIIGVAPNAWPRIVSSYFFPKYEIVSFRDRGENDYISQSGIKIFSVLKNDPRAMIDALSASQIISCPVVDRFLKEKKEIFRLLIYKSNAVLEKVLEEKGWQIIGNKSEVKNQYEDKRIFREVLKKVGIEPIPGKNIRIEELTEEKFVDYQNKFGQKNLVLQLAEVTYGGGSGTLFINDAKDLRIFRQRVVDIREKLEGKKKKIETVNICPYINSISSSIGCCATRYGTYCGPIQTQVIDITEVGTNKKNRSGNFAGHDWSFRHWPESIQKQADEIARKFGDYIYTHGYRGIFGLDLLIDEKNNKVWPMECNPRFTDAFPMLSLLYMGVGLIPFDVFHILELLNIDYQIDFEQQQAKYRQRFDYSQILLHNILEEESINTGIFKAGVYRVNNNDLEYLRPGFAPFHLQADNEFLFTEGVPKIPGEIFGDMGRVCRLIKKGPILDKINGLSPNTKQIIELAYSKFKLVKYEPNN